MSRTTQMRMHLRMQFYEGDRGHVYLSPGVDLGGG